MRPVPSRLRRRMARFGASVDRVPAAGDRVMLQPTTGDMYYAENWAYTVPYRYLAYGTVARVGERLSQAYTYQNQSKGTAYIVKSVPEVTDGVEWYAVTYDGRARKDMSALDADPSSGAFLYWPTVSRTKDSIVPVPPDRFRLTFATANAGSFTADQREQIQPLLDAMTSIYLSRIGPFVRSIAPGLDADGYDRARIAATHALVQAVSSIWIDYIHGLDDKKIREDASRGIVPTSSDTVSTPDQRSGAWNTLGLIRTEADVIFDHLKIVPDGSMAKILGAIVREPDTAGDVYQGRSAGSLVKTFGIFGISDLNRAAQIGDGLWGKRTSPSASAAAPAAPSPAASAAPPILPPVVALPASRPPPAPKKETDWLPLALAAVGGVAVVALLRRASADT